MSAALIEEVRGGYVAKTAVPWALTPERLVESFGCSGTAIE